MATQHDTPVDARAAARDAEAGLVYKQVYVQLSDAPYAYGELIDCGRVVDYAADGTPIGVEFLRVDGCVGVTGLPRSDQVAEALRRHDIGVCA